MGSKPVKSGEGVTNVKYNSNNNSQSTSRTDNASSGMRSTPQSTPPAVAPLPSGSADKEKPRKGFTYSSPEKHRRDVSRETKVVDDEGKALDAGFSFRREKVHRVPTKAVLKPPKDKNSLIAQPDEDEEYDVESRGNSASEASDARDTADNESQSR